MKISQDSIPDYPIKKVQLDALVLLQILKSSKTGQAVSGPLLGVEEKGILILTNSFPLPTLNSLKPSSHQTASSQAAQATAGGAPEENAGPPTGSAPQTFEDEHSIREYQAEMIEVLKTMEYETNEVGLYSTYTSALIPFDEIIESQFSLQSKIPQGIFFTMNLSLTDGCYYEPFFNGWMIRFTTTRPVNCRLL